MTDCACRYKKPYFNGTVRTRTAPATAETALTGDGKAAAVGPPDRLRAQAV